jgi:H+/Cl- antiporter ClcA
MDPRFSLKVYPRKDQVYKTKSSYNFEVINSRVYVNRKKAGHEEVIKWSIHALIGLLMGTIGFLMSVSEEFFAKIHAETTQHLLENSKSILFAFLFFIGMPAVFALGSACMTLFYGPGAAGSGVPEVMAMLNGVHGGPAANYQALITKSCAVVMSVLGGLCVGKEGPLVHIGSVAGLLVPYVPFDCFKPFRNDQDKRLFMAAGCAAGVAVAFGAPIGGTLFTYEISKPNTFWTFSMLWKTFFTAAVGVFQFGFLTQL